MSFETIAGALERQRAYSDHFFDPKTLTDGEKEEITKTFALSLHSEVSEIASAVNFKDHRRVQVPVDHSKLLYKSVDAFRYVLALLNLWEIDAQTFIEACKDKDVYLHRRHLESGRSAGDRPVVIFDVDDVIVEFRTSFFDYLDSKWGIKADPNDKQYYSSAELQKGGLDAETAFSTFITDGGFRALRPSDTVVEVMRMCQSAGFWVQILTARPSGNLKCFYDTHHWLQRWNIPYDSIAFSPEKYLWLLGQSLFERKQLVCVLDDSTKHASEFAKHGVPVIVPTKSYNEDTAEISGITRIKFDQIRATDLFDFIVSHQRQNTPSP